VNDAPLRIEIVYAEPQRAIHRSLRLAPGSRVADALQVAALDPHFAGVDLWNAALGIFGRLTRADHALQDGDRIEIYRPLTADPKAARRARAQRTRKKT
jgi:uncharacterized protein